MHVTTVSALFSAIYEEHQILDLTFVLKLFEQSKYVDRYKFCHVALLDTIELHIQYQL